jgi:hypothetical protein
MFIIIQGTPGIPRRSAQKGESFHLMLRFEGHISLKRRLSLLIDGCACRMVFQALQ